MGYFIIIIFSSFLGNPPELLPIAFKSKSDCEKYLIEQVQNDYNYMKKVEVKEYKYLANIANNSFIVCEELKYPKYQNMIKTKIK